MEEIGVPGKNHRPAASHHPPPLIVCYTTKIHVVHKTDLTTFYSLVKQSDFVLEYYYSKLLSPN